MFVRFGFSTTASVRMVVAVNYQLSLYKEEEKKTEELTRS